MKFAFDLAKKNIKRKPFRSTAMVVLVLLLSMFLYIGADTIISLQSGLAGYRARLGADIIVVPTSATGHGTVDDIFLQGITGNYYMSLKEIEKIRAVDGIATSTTQFFLTSAKASCCSTRVQIIGFDPETDITIQPWVSEAYSREISDGEVIAGANLSIPENKVLTFYGQDYHVAARLNATGTGLDSAVYANMNTVKQMAENAKVLLQNDALANVNFDTAASALYINVADGFEISDVVDDINIHVTKVQAKSSRTMISDISEGLNGVSRVIGVLILVTWALAILILIAVFALISNERKKEFAILRTLGATKGALFQVMSFEAGVLSLIGAVMGVVIAFIISLPLSDMLGGMLGLPFLAQGAVARLLTGVCAIVLATVAGLLAASFSARRITRGDTGLLLREDA